MQGHTYHLTGPEALTYTEVAETFARVLGQSIVYLDLPSDRYREMLKEQGVSPWLAKGLAALALSFQSAEPSPVSPVVEEITGFAPRRLDAFIQDHRQAFAPVVAVDR